MWRLSPICASANHSFGTRVESDLLWLPVELGEFLNKIKDLPLNNKGCSWTSHWNVCHVLAEHFHSSIPFRYPDFSSTPPIGVSERLVCLQMWTHFTACQEMMPRLKLMSLWLKEAILLNFSFLKLCAPSYGIWRERHYLLFRSPHWHTLQTIALLNALSYFPLV